MILRNFAYLLKAVQSPLNSIKNKILQNTKMSVNKTLAAHREMLLSLASDCTFLVGQCEDKQEFNAFKGVLALSSPVFTTMFFGEQAKTENKTESEVIEIPDVTPAAFQILLYHAYFLPGLANKKYWPSMNIAMEVLYAGHKYMIYGLMNEAVKYLKEKLSAETIFAILHAARLYELKELENICLNFFMENTTKCLEADQFLQTSLDELRVLFSYPDMNICSELELLLALERYIEENGLNRNEENQQSSKIEDVLKEIRLLTLDSKDFAQLIKSTVLTADEKLAIVSHLSCPTSDYSLPSTINSNRNERESTEDQKWINHIKMFFQKHGDKNISHSGCENEHAASTILWDCAYFFDSPLTELNEVFDKLGIENIRSAVESDSKELKLALCKYFKNRGVDVYKMFKL